MELRHRHAKGSFLVLCCRSHQIQSLKSLSSPRKRKAVRHPANQPPRTPRGQSRCRRSWHFRRSQCKTGPMHSLSSLNRPSYLHHLHQRTECHLPQQTGWVSGEHISYLHNMIIGHSSELIVLQSLAEHLHAFGKCLRNLAGNHIPLRAQGGYKSHDNMQVQPLGNAGDHR